MSYFHNLLAALLGMQGSQRQDPTIAFLSDEKCDVNRRFREEQARKERLCEEASQLLLEARSRLEQELATSRISVREFDAKWITFLDKMRRLYTPQIVGLCLERLGLPNVDEHGNKIHERFSYAPVSW